LIIDVPAVDITKFKNRNTVVSNIGASLVMQSGSGFKLLFLKKKLLVLQIVSAT
jgi:hypothetical protein